MRCEGGTPPPERSSARGGRAFPGRSHCGREGGSLSSSACQRGRTSLPRKTPPARPAAAEGKSASGFTASQGRVDSLRGSGSCSLEGDPMLANHVGHPRAARSLTPNAPAMLCQRPKPDDGGCVHGTVDWLKSAAEAGRSGERSLGRCERSQTPHRLPQGL